MKAYTLKDFAKEVFGSTAGMARAINRPENSLYRLNKKGAIVVTHGSKFTIYKNGKEYQLEDTQA